MPPRIPAVKTPGSYNLAKGKTSKVAKRKKGRPSSQGKAGSSRKDNYMSRYTAEDMQNAWEKVQMGWSVAKAAREYGVPRITLMDRLKGNHKTGVIGRPRALSAVEEDVLVDLLVLMGEFGYPVSKPSLREMVKGYLDKRRDSRYGFFKPGTSTNCR
jgi:hypothetical protein